MIPWNTKPGIILNPAMVLPLLLCYTEEAVFFRSQVLSLSYPPEDQKEDKDAESAENRKK